MSPNRLFSHRFLRTFYSQQLADKEITVSDVTSLATNKHMHSVVNFTTAVGRVIIHIISGLLIALLYTFFHLSSLFVDQIAFIIVPFYLFFVNKTKMMSIC